MDSRFVPITGFDVEEFSFYLLHLAAVVRTLRHVLGRVDAGGL
jgi:hypothetical protein